LSLAGWHDLFKPSRWLLLTNFLNFLHNGSANFIIGKISGAQSLGLYNISYEIANLPTAELVSSISRATFPGYAKIALDPAALRAMFLKVTGVIALITIPAGAGIAATSDRIVGLALGRNWVAASPFIAVLACYGVIQSLQSNSGAVLLALGKFRALSAILGIQAAVLIPAMVWGAYRGGAMGVALALLAAGMVLAPINLAQVFRAINLRLAAFLAVIWRPVVAAAIMYAMIALALRSWHVESFLEQLRQTMVLVALGAISYTSLVLGLWTLVSRPPGAEQYVLERLQIGRTLRRLGFN
jgi:O-antigen/teichoic acid export membrane protein